MPKTTKVTPINFEKTIMAKVRSNKIAMKPKWYFISGSVLMASGLISLSVVSVFLTNLTLFLMRRHKPMTQWRFEQILTSLPVWIPLLAIFGTVSGILLLKKYDFSYKKNFMLIIIGFVLSIVIAGFIIDYLGFNDIWSQQGPMRRFYQQIENNNAFPRRFGRGN